MKKKHRKMLYGSAAGALGVSLMGKPEYAGGIFGLGAGMMAVDMLKDSTKGIKRKKKSYF